jgi:hypothetical protein
MAGSSVWNGWVNDLPLFYRSFSHIPNICMLSYRTIGSPKTTK